MRSQYKFNYISVEKDEFYECLTPQIKAKLWKVLIKFQKTYFLYFFENPSIEFKVPKYIIQTMLSHLNCQIYPPDTMLLRAGDEVNDIYLIKSGRIQVMNTNYNRLCEYSDHAFFGEYQIMFDLYAGCYYRTGVACVGKHECVNKSKTHQIILLTINKQVFLELISENGNYTSFRHYHDIAVMKFKNIQKLKRADNLYHNIIELNYGHTFN